MLRPQKRPNNSSPPDARIKVYRHHSDHAKLNPNVAKHFQAYWDEDTAGTTQESDKCFIIQQKLLENFLSAIQNDWYLIRFSLQCVPSGVGDIDSRMYFTLGKTLSCSLPFCKHCGSEVGADAKFCTSCGKRLKGEEPDTVANTTSTPNRRTVSENRATLIQELLRTISDEEAVETRHRLEAYHLAMAAYETLFLNQSDPFSLENWRTVEAALAAKYGLPDESILRSDEPTKKTLKGITVCVVSSAFICYKPI